jgi:hypothetical protein
MRMELTGHSHNVPLALAPEYSGVYYQRLFDATIVGRSTEWCTEADFVSGYTQWITGEYGGEAQEGWTGVPGETSNNIISRDYLILRKTPPPGAYPHLDVTLLFETMNTLTDDLTFVYGNLSVAVFGTSVLTDDSLVVPGPPRPRPPKFPQEPFNATSAGFEPMPISMALQSAALAEQKASPAPPVRISEPIADHTPPKPRRRRSVHKDKADITAIKENLAVDERKRRSAAFDRVATIKSEASRRAQAKIRAANQVNPANETVAGGERAALREPNPEDYKEWEED